MKNIKQIQKFIDTSVKDILDVPHAAAMSSVELLGILSALDAINRNMHGAKHQDAWFEFNRRAEAAGVVDKDFMKYISDTLRQQLGRESTDREQMTAICQFWREHMLESGNGDSNGLEIGQ